MKGIIKNKEGTAAIEFGLIAMGLFMMIFGIIEFGLLLYNNSMLTHASRIAARTGVMYWYKEDPSAPLGFYNHSNDEFIRNAAETFWKDKFITFGNNPDSAYHDDIKRISVSDSSIIAYGEEESNDMLEITLTYDYDFLFLKIFGLGPITLTARTSMRFE
jgi:hypothetical protein